MQWRGNCCTRIITLSSLWNIQLVSSFLTRGHINVNFRRFNRNSNTKLIMSTSSSPLPDDISSTTTDDIKPSARRSPRKKVPAGENSIDMLEDWIQHDNHTYHLDNLSPTEAYKIRVSLVEWYRANRRKLPWRGDAGPYNGSTAGYAGNSSASSKGKAAGKKRKDEGKDIRSFFAASASSKKKQKKVGESKASSKQQPSVEKEEEEAREVTAYGIWVSEIMLQQTRVEAVIPYWIKWMNSFPTVHCLANATDEEVNSHWAGLGFYRRARLLHAGAKRVVDDYDGIVPNTVEELMKVEGIGRYTASAVASIAYGVEVPVVDGNVCRVLSRLTGIANHIKAGVMKDDLGWTLAERIVQAKPSEDGDEKKESKGSVAVGSPGEINQALMELGATYCSPAGSGIDNNDPLKEFYTSTKLGVAIGQANNSGAAVRDRIESLIANNAVENGGQECRLCEAGGVSTAYYNIMDRITTDLSTDSKTKPDTIYATAGHASLPIPPPKKSKREEVIAVAVISSQMANKEKCWLMVKRPKEGLLAGQWEFPKVCVWNSAEEQKKDKGKKKAGGKPTVVEVPVIDPAVRSDALDSFLTDIFQANDDMPSGLSKRTQLKDDPVVHIFSHVCHTMWIEHCEVETDGEITKRWKLNNQEIGWMTESMMAKVGITSLVRKVLSATK